MGVHSSIFLLYAVLLALVGIQSVFFPQETINFYTSLKPSPDLMLPLRFMGYDCQNI
jgi:hypothetical protein